MNTTLKRALADARLRDVDVATALGVDPKTVQRWLAGRLPQPRHRWGVADLVGLAEDDLWPDACPQASSPEIEAIYPHRAAVPPDVWRRLFGRAKADIGVLVYSGLFLAEDAECRRIFAEKARAGVSVRITLGDPESPHVIARGAEEGIEDAMAAKVRNAIVLYRPLLGIDRFEVRLHRTVLYNSIFRADDELLANPHVFGAAAAFAPVLHVRASEGAGSVAPMVGTYRESFERVWRDATPLV